MENMKTSLNKKYNISSIEELMLDNADKFDESINLNNNPLDNHCSSYECNAASNAIT